MQLSVKDVNEAVFREFKAESVREGLKIGKALTLAMELFIEKKEKKNKMSLLNLKPKSWGKSTKTLSEEIDRVIY